MVNSSLVFACNSKMVYCDLAASKTVIKKPLIIIVFLRLGISVVDAAVKLIIESFKFISLEILSFQSKKFYNGRLGK